MILPGYSALAFGAGKAVPEESTLEEPAETTPAATDTDGAPVPDKEEIPASDAYDTPAEELTAVPAESGDDQTDSPIGEDLTRIDKFTAQLSSGAVEKDGVWKVPIPTYGNEWYQEITPLTYKIVYNISGNVDHAPGTVTIRIPAHMYQRRDWTADKPVYADVCSLSVPQAPTNEDNVYNYTYDAETDEYVLTNCDVIPAADEQTFTFTYKVYGFTSMIVDESWSTPFSPTFEIQKEDGTKLETSADADQVLYDTEVHIEQPYKRQIQKYETFPSGWGDAPENADDYFYIVWEIHAEPKRESTAAYHITLKDIPDENGELVAYKGQYITITRKETDRENKTHREPFFYRMDEPGAPEQLEQDKFAYVYNNTNKYLEAQVLVKYPKSLVADGEDHVIYNTVESTLTGIDNGETEKASKTVSFTYRTMKFTAPPGYEYLGKSKNTSIRNEEMNTGAVNVLLAGKEAPANTTYFKNNLTLTGWPYTLKADGDASDPADWQQKPYTVELIDDAFFLGQDYSQELDGDDFEISTIYIDSNLYRFSSWEPDENAGRYTFKSVPMRECPDVELWGKNKQNEWELIWTFTSKDGYLRAKLPDGTYHRLETYYNAIPPGYHGLKLVTTTSYGRVSLQLYVWNIKLFPSERVKGILQKHEQESPGTYVEVKDVNTMRAFDADGNFIGITGDYIGAGAQRMKEKDEQEYGRHLYHTAADCGINSLHKTSSIFKEIRSYTNETEKKRLKVNYSVNASESMSHPNDDNEWYIENGLFEEQKEGTYYDLLPKGMIVDEASVVARCNSYAACDYNVEFTDNWRGSGRTMMIVHCSVPEGGKNYYGGTSTGISSGFRIDYTGYYPWDAVNDYGKTVNNYVAYETGNESITNGAPDTGVSKSLNQPALMGDLDPESDGERFLYTQVTKTLIADISTELSLTKKVREDANAAWKDGIEQEVRVGSGGVYTYRLRFGAAVGTKASNIILFDSLENYTPEGVTQQWRGTLDYVDLSQPLTKGVAPVVYYSTVPGLFIPDHPDLTDTAVWSTTMPEDKSQITAVAVDMRYDQNGEPYVLQPEETITVLLGMKAVTEHVNELFLNDTAAYNNVYLSNDLNDMIVGDMTKDNFVEYAYTKVQLLPDTAQLSLGKEVLDPSGQGVDSEQAFTFAVKRDGLTVDRLGYRYDVVNADGSKAAENVPVAEGGLVTLKGSQTAVFKGPENAVYEGILAGEYQITEGKEDGFMAFYTVDGGTPKVGLETGDVAVDPDADCEVVFHNVTAPEVVLTGTKDWNDKSNKYGRRPETIELTIEADGQKVDPDDYTVDWKKDGDQWTYTITGLPRYTFDYGKTPAKETVYVVKEVLPDGYISPQSETGVSTEGLEGPEKKLPPLTNDWAYGDLRITKNLPSFETTGRTTFVFSVRAVLPDAADGEDRVVFDDVVTLDFEKAGTQTALIKEIPAGAVVTVTEEYSGASYQQTADPVWTDQDQTIRSNEELGVTFDNTYDGGLGQGSGILNVYRVNDSGGWEYMGPDERNSNQRE